MQLKHTYEASVKEPVSPIQLARFQSNPNVHGPNMGAVRLDLTSSTRRSNWNQAVVELLAEVAKSTYPGISAKVHWRRLFTTRIDRIISDATHFRKVGISYEETRRKKVLKLALHRVKLYSITENFWPTIFLETSTSLPNCLYNVRPLHIIGRRRWHPFLDLHPPILKRPRFHRQVWRDCFRQRVQSFLQRCHRLKFLPLSVPYLVSLCRWHSFDLSWSFWSTREEAPRNSWTNDNNTYACNFFASSGTSGGAFLVFR